MDDPVDAPACAPADRPRFYDAAYRVFDTAQECDSIAEILRGYGLQTIDTILDIGCGPGHHLREFARRGIRAAGIDSDPLMLAYARRLAEKDGARVSLCLADMRQFSLGMQVDAAICLGASFNSLTTETDAVAALQSIAAHLRPEALLALELHYPRAVYGSSLVARWTVSHLRGTARCTFAMHPIPGASRLYDWDTTIDFYYKSGRPPERASFHCQARPWLRREIARAARLSGCLELVGWHVLKRAYKTRHILSILRRSSECLPNVNAREGLTA